MSIDFAGAKLVLDGIINSSNYKEVINLISSDIDRLEDIEVNKRVEKVAYLLGLPVLSYGFWRIVLMYENFAVKIPFCTKDQSSNNHEADLIKNIDARSEIDISYEVREELLSYLCPQLASNGVISVSPICDISKDVEILDTKEIIDRFKELQIELTDVDKVEQWGYLNNHLVLLDFPQWYDKVTRCSGDLC